MSPLIGKRGLASFGSGVALVLPLIAQIAVSFGCIVPVLCVLVAAALVLLSPWRDRGKGVASSARRRAALRNLAVLPALSLIAVCLVVSFSMHHASVPQSLKPLLNGLTLLLSGLAFAGELRVSRIVLLRSLIMRSGLAPSAKDFLSDVLALGAAVLCLPRFLAREYAELRARGQVTGGRKTLPFRGIVAAFGAALRELADDIFVRL